jgi:hypothetical protein
LRPCPPPFLGAFDCEKIAFLPYHADMDFFAVNDFDWTVTPSDPKAREFGLLLDRLRPLLAAQGVSFRFAEARELAAFLRKNLRAGQGAADGLPVTRNNFVFVWNRWREAVMPSIAVDWEVAKGQGILDADFQLDCLVCTLFHGQNRISCKEGVNHWIPFAEEKVGAKDAYRSRFMVEWLGTRLEAASPSLGDAATCRVKKRDVGETRREAAPPREGLGDAASCRVPLQGNLFGAGLPLVAEGRPAYGASAPTPEARAVLDAGRELWRYYHAQPGALPDASFYDIRARFQGFKPNGHMNPDSPDATYTRLLSALRDARNTLAARIASKVRGHAFLR